MTGKSIGDGGHIEGPQWNVSPTFFMTPVNGEAKPMESPGLHLSHVVIGAHPPKPGLTQSIVS